MYLQPSTSVLYNDRRELFAFELMTGGHGQVYLSGAGTFTPSTSAFVFYRIDFLTNSVVSNVAFRSVADDGTTTLYQVDQSSFTNIPFTSGETWLAPLTSITLASGKAIAYQYCKFPPEDYICSSSCN
jgi:hypothetical protein